MHKIKFSFLEVAGYNFYIFDVKLIVKNMSKSKKRKKKVLVSNVKIIADFKLFYL